MRRRLTRHCGDKAGTGAVADDPLLHLFPGKFVAKNVTIVDFAGLLQGGVLDRPVVDQTDPPGDTTSGWYTGPISL